MPMSGLERTRKQRPKKKFGNNANKKSKNSNLTVVQRETRSRKKAAENLMQHSSEYVANNTSSEQSTSATTKDMSRFPAHIPRVRVTPYHPQSSRHTRWGDEEVSSSLPSRSTLTYSPSYELPLYPNIPQYNFPPANLPVHPDCQFKKLPFYDCIDTLIKPSTLMPKTSSRKQEKMFTFHLTPQQAADIDNSCKQFGGGEIEYFKQVQMRFCLMETTCPQEDCFPMEIVVKVNGKICNLPCLIASKQPGTPPKRPARPVNITHFIKLSPTTTNYIHVEWAPEFGRNYAITIDLVHKRTASDLLNKMKMRGVKHSDITRGIIKEKLKEDTDNEIATTSLRVSLICPLGKMRMTNPCRSRSCNHLQCFDASLYLQMNERKPSWMCPVCNIPTSLDDLYIDGYFQWVLESPEVNSDTKEIQLHKDGSWSVQNDTEVASIDNTVEQESNEVDNCIEILDDDSMSDYFDEKTKEEVDENQPLPKPEIKNEVVDLTQSDSEDDEPLSKLLENMSQATKSYLSDNADSSEIESRMVIAETPPNLSPPEDDVISLSSSTSSITFSPMSSFDSDINSRMNLQAPFKTIDELSSSTTSITFSSPMSSFGSDSNSHMNLQPPFKNIDEQQSEDQTQQISDSSMPVLDIHAPDFKDEFFFN